MAGEVLIDLVTGPDGRFDARRGGGPYNAARSLARLGVPATFIGRTGDDAFGRLLRDQLAADGVVLGVAEPSERPTTLAVVTLDETGSAGYAFYLESAAADVDEDAMRKALPPELTAMHVGALGLIMEPMGAAIESLVLSGLPGDPLLFLDPNCRPAAVPGYGAYRARVGAIARRADIVKASTEDLGYLYPGVPPQNAARALLAEGTSLVLVTDGPRPARAFTAGEVLSEQVPAVIVADTIGAGDAFGGAFLAWWTTHGLGRDELHRIDLVRPALRAATAAAALTCTRPGADPPALAELRARNWWPLLPLLSAHSVSPLASAGARALARGRLPAA
ncbi:carbohydrate kinase family protein [Trebonia kvetii]|uniref:carbohydrate kinase family protein n=1 Tax=Trebonia kvetii TaxID=2480626 RepID=UPI001651B37D|nr:carbohydrate kinase [Trebonia kvetii]